MNRKTMTIDTNKKYIIQSYDDNIFIIEFAEPQDIYPEEEFLGMYAYECYILDNDYEAESRAIYYYAEDDDTQYLKYRKDSSESKLTTICIQNIIPINNLEAIKNGMSIEQVLEEALEGVTV